MNNKIAFFKMSKGVLLTALLLIFQVANGQDAEAQDASVFDQLNGLLMKSEMKIPDVDLGRKINLSDTTRVIDRAIVYNSIADSSYHKTFYYWSQDHWRPIISDTSRIEKLVLWNQKKQQLAYTDAQADVVIVGVGGLEQSRFVKVDTQNYTLIYKDEKEREIKVSISELVDATTDYNIIIQNGNQLSFNDGAQFVMIDLLTAPRPQKRLVKSQGLKTNLIEVLTSEFYENALSQVEEEVKEDEDEFIKSNVPEVEVVEVRKTREGREIKAIEDNEDGTFAIVYADGSRFTSLDLTNPKVEVVREIASVVNNGDGTFTANFTDGTSLSSKEVTDFYNFGGKDEDGSDVELVIDNGDGTYDVILSNGKKLESIDFARLGQPEEKKSEEDGRGVLSVSNNSDGTFTVQFTDGTEMHSSDMAELELIIEGNIKDVVGAIDEDSDNKSIEQEEILTEGDVEELEEESELRIKSIVKSDSDTFIILLSNGIFFEASQNFGKADDSGKTVSIENLIDNTDGSYTMVFSDGVELKSVNTLPKKETLQPAEQNHDEELEEMPIEMPTTEEYNQEVTGESADEEGVVEEKGEDGDGKSNEEREKEETKEQAVLEESVVNEKESVDSSIISKTQEEVIRDQKAEIEALKKREEEKEQEIREMNRRLKRLESLIGED